MRPEETIALDALRQIGIDFTNRHPPTQDAVALFLLRCLASFAAAYRAGPRWPSYSQHEEWANQRMRLDMERGSLDDVHQVALWDESDRLAGTAVRGLETAQCSFCTNRASSGLNGMCRKCWEEGWAEAEANGA